MVVSLWGRNLSNTRYNTFAVDNAATGTKQYFAQRGNPIQIIGFQGLTHLSSHNLVVFRKAQWMNADFPSSPSEFCDYVL